MARHQANGASRVRRSIGQISLLINTIFASFLVTGSVSWLYYADRLMEFPAGLLGVALGTVLLPSLSRHYADNSTEEYVAAAGLGPTLDRAFDVAGRAGIGTACNAAHHHPFLSWGIFCQ